VILVAMSLLTIKVSNMTNKLPVVGRSYKCKRSKRTGMVFAISGDWLTVIYDINDSASLLISDFFDCFEELLEDNSRQEKPQKNMSIKELSKIAVDKIIYDVADRRGLKYQWNAIDSEIQREITHKWENIIIQTFEEILKDNSQQTEQVQVREFIFSEEVREAMEELKKLDAASEEFLKPVTLIVGRIINKSAKDAIEAALELICVYGAASKNLLNAFEQMQKYIQELKKGR